MAKPTVTPTIGRVVIYVWPDKNLRDNNNQPTSPAVVVNAWENSSYENGECNLKVLADGEINPWATSVPYSEGNEPRTWHWPPRS